MQKLKHLFGRIQRHCIGLGPASIPLDFLEEKTQEYRCENVELQPLRSRWSCSSNRAKQVFEDRTQTWKHWDKYLLPVISNGLYRIYVHNCFNKILNVCLYQFLAGMRNAHHYVSEYLAAFLGSPFIAIWWSREVKSFCWILLHNILFIIVLINFQFIAHVFNCCPRYKITRFPVSSRLRLIHDIRMPTVHMTSKSGGLLQIPRIASKLDLARVSFWRARRHFGKRRQLAWYGPLSWTDRQWTVPNQYWKSTSSFLLIWRRRKLSWNCRARNDKYRSFIRLTFQRKRLLQTLQKRRVIWETIRPGVILRFGYFKS